MLDFVPDSKFQPVPGFGPAGLNAQGTFAQDFANPQGRRRLVLDLSLFLRGVPAGPIGGALATATLIRNVHFEIRTDLPYSLVGADTWSAWCAALGPRLPSYAAILARPLIRSAPFRTIRLSLLPIEFDYPTPTGPRPPRAPFRSNIGLHPDIPPAACILGSDILHHGLLAWENGYTFFFRFVGGTIPDVHDRVRAVNPTPI